MTMALPDPRTLLLSSQDIVPVTILSGFLGSGKTTIIRQLLTYACDTAVIVNEFGEVGLDHLLLESADDNIALLPGGCLCCQARGDLARALRSLQDRSALGQAPAFRRVIVETSGLADPGPILQVLLSDPLRLSRYRFAGLVTTADAVLGAGQLAGHAVAQSQVALADRILLTKLDIAASADRQRLVEALARHSAAPVEDRASDAGLERQLFAFDVGARPRFRAIGTDHGAHDGLFTAISLGWTGRVELAGLHAELTAFALEHGETLLRLKGIVDVAGAQTPASVHAVQHLVERPRLMATMPAGPWRGIVAICRRQARNGIADRLGQVLRASTADRAEIHREHA